MVISKEALEEYRRQRQEAVARKTGRWSRGRDPIIRLMRRSKSFFSSLMNAAGVPEDLRAVVAPEFESYLRSAKNLGDLDRPDSHLIIANLVEQVRKAAIELQLPTGAEFVFGAHLGEGLTASQLAVAGEQESIIEISRGLIVFLNCVSKSFAALLTYPANDLVEIDPGAAIERFRSTPDFRRDWEELIDAFAISNTVPPRRPPPSPVADNRFAVKKELLDAMEIFVVAHEFGHHALEHGVSDPNQLSSSAPLAPELELDADRYAHMVGVRISLAEQPANCLGLSGAGIVLALSSLELVQKAKQVLQTGSDTLVPSITHPSVHERISAIAQMDEFAPEEIRLPSLVTRSHTREIMERLWLEVRPHFLSLHDQGVRPKAIDGQDIARFICGNT